MTLPDLASIVLPGLVGLAAGALLMLWHWWQAERAEYAPAASYEARITSLQASLDDAHREVSRLTGEKHARDTVIHQGIEVLQSLHRQGENGGE